LILLLPRLWCSRVHELAVTQRVLDIAVEKAEEANAARVTRINLVIGEMSSIVDDCVQFYFDFLSQDSIASGATLTFERIPAKLRCRQCGHSFTPNEPPWNCPRCHQWDVEILAGQEFYIDSIEVD
jgi:hydrogenase nickel incorporation protein HypA/HybF